ncbi:hypothetical protein BDQ17DRAFT_1353767 [Cyathus striatus]|nr:hypothetical protein BDQ17DRAFT_1353767 [Cyathus striatus]
MDWDEEYDLEQSHNSNPTGGSSFLERARNALDDDDDDLPLGRVVPTVNPGTPPPFTDDETNETSLEKLMRHWMNERHAPDILPAQQELLSSVLDHLRRQSEAVQLLRGDPSTSDEEHLRIMLVQTEIERVKFIIRSYVRTRLYKIERYARFIVTDAAVQTRLTAVERDHASRQAKLTDRHFYFSVLQSLPEVQAHLDDPPAFTPSMTTQPDKTRPVFVHALKECPRVTLPDGTSLTMQKGHISLTPYSVVEHLVARGEVELV